MRHSSIMAERSTPDPNRVEGRMARPRTPGARPHPAQAQEVTGERLLAPRSRCQRGSRYWASLLVVLPLELLPIRPEEEAAATGPDAVALERSHVPDDCGAAVPPERDGRHRHLSRPLLHVVWSAREVVRDPSIGRHRQRGPAAVKECL